MATFSTGIGQIYNYEPLSESEMANRLRLIYQLIHERQDARLTKNYVQADLLRNALEGLGVEVIDSPITEGYSWRMSASTRL